MILNWCDGKVDPGGDDVLCASFVLMSNIVTQTLGMKTWPFDVRSKTRKVSTRSKSRMFHTASVQILPQKTWEYQVCIKNATVMLQDCNIQTKLLECMQTMLHSTNILSSNNRFRCGAHWEKVEKWPPRATSGI